MTPKQNVRFIGFDDGPFKLSGEKKKEKTILVGVVCRAGKGSKSGERNSITEAVLSAMIAVDGLDSTDAIVKLSKDNRYSGQLKAIFLSGITFGGFNVADIRRISEAARKPVIVVIKKMPDLKKFVSAMKNAGSAADFKNRMRMLDSAGKIRSLAVRKSRIFYQAAGASPAEAEKLISLACDNSVVPEPLRLAHIVASGVCKPEKSMVRRA